MSKDLLKRAEEEIVVLKSAVESLGYLRIEEDNALKFIALIQDLLDKLKGDAERIESKEFLDYMDLNFYSAMCTWYGNDRDFEEGLCKELAQQAINVIKGDDNDR